jgi:tetratricopeptide (TPR) repeat protein
MDERRPRKSRNQIRAAPTRRVDWRLGVIVLAGVLTYITSFSGPFLFDDFGGIVRNPSIRSLTDLRALLSTPDATPVAGRWLTNASFAVNYAVGGLDVTGYHVVNLALHLICAVLFYAIVRRTLIVSRWTGQSGAPNAAAAANTAFAIVLLWTVHPLNSEVVLYLSERSESLMAVCYLFTLYAGVRAANAERPWRWFAAGIASCAAGVLCKESMVTAPVVVALYDRVFLFSSLGDAWRARGRFYSGLAASWVLLAASLFSHGSISSSGFASAHSTTWMYLLNQTVIVTRYLRLAIWPRPLVLYYGWTRTLTLVDVWSYALFLALLIAAALVVFARWPRFGFSAVWTIITLTPSSSLAPIATEVGAERRMYLPLMGIMTMAVVSAAMFVRARSTGAASNRRDRALVWTAAVVAIALAVSTILRSREYASSLTMARTVLAGWDTPGAHQLLGQELASSGQHDAAIAELRRALPEATVAHYLLGNELITTGQLDAGVAQLQEFVRLEPSLVPSRLARVSMARVYASRQQWPQAIAQLDDVLAEWPTDAAAHGLLADILSAQQKFGDAVPHYRTYLQGNPHDGNAWTGLGVALVATGNAADAIAAFREAVRSDAANPNFRLNLARLLLDAGDAASAASEAQQAVGLAPSDATAHQLFGRALAAQGRRDDARRELERALEIDPSDAVAREALNALGRLA